MKELTNTQKKFWHFSKQVSLKAKSRQNLRLHWELYIHLSTLMKIYNAKNRINLIYKTFQDNTINYSKLNLTSRDIQIINHLLDGETSKNIANKIGISFYCVRCHKENMLTRNNCRTIIELISKIYSKNE